MDYIRQKVSGKKNRLKEGNFNLDLTYITQRIIAMSLPGEGFEGLYRNPIDQLNTVDNNIHIFLLSHFQVTIKYFILQKFIKVIKKDQNIDYTQMKDIRKTISFLI